MLIAVVNWTAVGVIVAAVIAAAGGAAKLAIRAGDRASGNLSTQLERIHAHLASQDRQHDRLAEQTARDTRQLGERLSRIEGTARRVESAVTNGDT